MVSDTLRSMVQEQYRFQALLGVVNIISNFENAWEVKKPECEHYIK